MPTATPNTAGAIARISKEIVDIQKGVDLSLAVSCKDSDVRHVRALIIGPPDTPYEFGFFEFDVKFGQDYPLKCPTVRCLTTDSGKTRFNPNIYNCGKVCLSILGTWRGKPEEGWSSAQGLESVLLSIQSLMSPNPYENEPGYDDSEKDEELPRAYIAKVRHETIRIAVLQPLELLMGLARTNAPDFYEQMRLQSSTITVASGTSTPHTEYSDSESISPGDDTLYQPFADLFKRRFLWYYDTYAKTIEESSTNYPKGTKFEEMDFEYAPNIMSGSFDYKSLEKRLKHLAKALEDERRSWEKEGKSQVERETQLATQLSFQFKQLAYRYNSYHPSTTSRLILSLPDPANPFIWTLTLFGKPMTNLDGGVWNLTLSIPPTFPEAQPRVNFETPIFHHRVSSSGFLCYFPQKQEEIASHLEAIVAAVEDENPTYDPRAVANPGAFALFWGGEEKRKFYYRKLRRSAQDSAEF